MDKIVQNESALPSTTFEEKVIEEKKIKTQVKKRLTNNVGIFIGVFLVFVVIIIVTTDVHLTSFDQVAALLLEFFTLLFCSYSMHVNCSDSGMRAGLASKTYIEAELSFNSLKKKITDLKLQSLLPSFCRNYVDEELKNTRLDILAVVGISYDKYQNSYMSLDDEGIDSLADLSKPQRDAIKRANKTTPIKLTPEMIMKKGGYARDRRSPLSVRPSTKKKIMMLLKLFTSALVAFLMILVEIKTSNDSVWIIFSNCILKLCTVVMSGFTGYKFGFENIVFDTVDYINDQADLMRQFLNFSENIPTETPTETSEKTT